MSPSPARSKDCATLLANTMRPSASVEMTASPMLARVALRYSSKCRVISCLFSDPRRVRRATTNSQTSLIIPLSLRFRSPVRIGQHRPHVLANFAEETVKPVRSHCGRFLGGRGLRLIVPPVAGKPMPNGAERTPQVWPLAQDQRRCPATFLISQSVRSGAVLRMPQRESSFPLCRGVCQKASIRSLRRKGDRRGRPFNPRAT